MIPIRHLPERIFDDTGRVIPYSQFQIKSFRSLMPHRSQLYLSPQGHSQVSVSSRCKSPYFSEIIAVQTSFASPLLYRGHRTLFKAVPAVQAVFLLNLKRLSRPDTPLGTVLCTGSAADALLCDLISFLRNLSLPHGIALPEDRVHSQIEIFNLRVSYHKYNANLSRISRIYI